MRPYGGATNNAATATDNTMVADITIVTDLDLIIDFYPIADTCIAQRPTICLLYTSDAADE